MQQYETEHTDSLQAQNTKTEKKTGKIAGISGSTLKIIAVISMLIDHTGAGVVGRYLSMAQRTGMHADISILGMQTDFNTLYRIYLCMRMIGRIAFPIYCFLLVEGFTYTRNRKKYAVRLAAFALISEIPFDLLFNGHALEFGYQNVFFTLLMGLLTMMAFQWFLEQEGFSRVLRILGACLALAAGPFAANLLQTDYAAIGVVCIMILYLSRKKKLYQIIAGCVAFLWEVTAPLAFVPIAFYNGKRGRQMKYFFYAFYPAHLLILYLLCMLLGISGYSAM